MKLAARRGIAALMCLAIAPSAADAWWGNYGCGDTCHSKPPNAIEKGAKKNIHWPSPHLCADRHHARAPFETMVTNGWRRQNLLGGHHFNENATELTQSGKLKVQWIMTQAPEQYRKVFIERSLEKGVTEARMAAAQTFAGLVARGETEPLVADTHIISEGRPAATVDFVNTQFRENMPTPTLPAPTTNNQASGQ